METELLILLSGSLLTAITQWLKPYFTVNPLVLAAILALIGGVFYSALLSYGVWEEVAKFAALAFSGAVTVFNILKQVNKQDEDLLL